jgi:hypothetical protein
MGGLLSEVGVEGEETGEGVLDVRDHRSKTLHLVTEVGCAHEIILVVETLPHGSEAGLIAIANAVTRLCVEDSRVLVTGVAEEDVSHGEGSA